MTTPDEQPFDPHTVPVFPRLAMEIDTSNRRVSIDGTPVEVDADADLVDAAVAAAAARIGLRNLSHARVAAVVDDERYTLVIGADGHRHSLDAPEQGQRRSHSGPKRPVWPLLVGAAVLMLIISTFSGVVIALHQRSSHAQVTAPVVPPPAELPVVPTDRWTTQAVWSTPLDANPGQAQVLLTETSVVTIGPKNRLIARDTTTGVEQWASDVKDPVEHGPVLSVIDGQDVISVVTTGSLLWWPVTGSPAPAGEIALDNEEEVNFAGSTPLISGRGQLARVIVDGVAVDRTIPAGAAPLRADAGVVLAVNTLGQMWRLDSAETYVPSPTALTGPKSAEGSVSIIGTSGKIFALQWSVPNGSTTLLYDLTGRRVGKSLDTTGRTWESSPTSTWATAGAVLINTTSGQHRVLGDGNWRTVSIGTEIYGTSSQELSLVNTATGHLRAESNPDATPPITSGEDRAFYAAENNDGQSTLYAVTRKDQ